MSEENGTADISVTEASQVEGEAVERAEEEPSPDAQAKVEEQQPEPEAKPEKTPEERERARLQRGIDRRTRQLYEERARAAQLEAELQRLTGGKQGVDYQSDKGDSEPLSLTQAQLRELVNAEAKKLAPTLQQEAEEHERRQSVIQSLEKQLGKERFDEVAADLDDALGGLKDNSGRPKPIVDAIFASSNPAGLVEYLADPEHADEASRISRLDPIRAGMAIAAIDGKLSAKQATPKVSKAPAPIEKISGRAGKMDNAPSDNDTDDDWVKKERQRMKEKGILSYG